jgi:hypothetical protein
VLQARLPALQRLTDGAVARGGDGLMPAPVVSRSSSRVLAGVLHRLDVATRGHWVWPLVLRDRLAVRRPLPLDAQREAAVALEDA